MRAPRLDALQMVLVEIARPPDDTGRVLGKMHDVLAGAATDLDDITGFAGKEFFQYRPDRHVVAMERRRVEPAVGLDRPAVLAELHYKLSHRNLALSCRLMRGSATQPGSIYEFSGDSTSRPPRNLWLRPKPPWRERRIGQLSRITGPARSGGPCNRPPRCAPHALSADDVYALCTYISGLNGLAPGIIAYRSE